MNLAVDHSGAFTWEEIWPICRYTGEYQNSKINNFLILHSLASLEVFVLSCSLSLGLDEMNLNVILKRRV